MSQSVELKKTQSDCEHDNWTGVANVRSSSGYHKTSYCKVQRNLLKAVSNHYTLQEIFGDLTAFLEDSGLLGYETLFLNAKELHSKGHETLIQLHGVTSQTT